ncbi:MAG: hypothetical protein KBF94_18210, partial [Ilumatobacteraceae bacterium]|nr:hypothetical protein [Ilumatobacteraceae bacterium]
MTRWRVILAVGVLVGTVAACSDDTSTATDGTSAAEATTGPAPETSVAATDVPVTDAPSTDAPTTDAPETTVDAAGVWETITAPADCMCGDGSEFSYFVHRADPTKVMFFLEGGGACFSADTCNPTSNTYKREVDYDGGFGAQGDPTGIFDFSNPMNPFANYSIVFVPYCT